MATVPSKESGADKRPKEVTKMKKYMLVYKSTKDGIDLTGAEFFDEYDDAEYVKQFEESRLGYYCEMYQRKYLDPNCPESGVEYMLIE